MGIAFNLKDNIESKLLHLLKVKKENMMGELVLVPLKYFLDIY